MRGLIAVFLRFATRPVPVADSLAKNAYGIYLVHYFFVIWLQYLLLGAPVFAVAKGVLVTAGLAVFEWAVASRSAACRSQAGRVSRRGTRGGARPANEAAMPDKP